MAEIHIQYSTSPAFASDVIRRLCHSDFSHIDIVLNSAEEHGLLGVSGEDRSVGDPGGVRIRPRPPWAYQGTPKVAKLRRVSNTVYDDFMRVAHGQIGKPFDHNALWGFLRDSPHEINWRQPNAWFCSEFVVWCLEQANFFPYRLVVKANRITPGDSLLLLNPFMEAENIQEFL
jgi:hypothetical protein